MDAPGFDARYEPAAVKAALPLEWALGQLFGVWGAGQGDMVPCPLPGHEDSTPSFNLWAPDEEGIPMRFGCFGCGTNGDVIDLIREARGIGFTDACTVAIDELLTVFAASEWEPSDGQLTQRWEADPRLLEEALDLLKDGPEHLDRFLEMKMPYVPAEYVADLWGWRGTYAGMPVVAFPHRDWDRTLRGIRYRSVRRGNRWTEKGSRFDALYGAHLDTGLPCVLLAEGETDTVYADWQLRDAPVDVMGLASGAAQRPPEEAVGRLTGREVWLAFDGDMAGRIATNLWRSALDGWAAVHVVWMPDGEDICSCGIPAKDLMEGDTT